LNRATPYFPRFAADPRYGLDVMRPLDYSCYAGASVFLSTPADMVRFAMAIQQGTLLQPATVTRLFTSPRLASGEETGHGLGWEREEVTLDGMPTRAIARDGTVLGGVTTSLLIVPDSGIVVSVMSNTAYSDAPAIASNIADAFARREMTTR
jgi:CubicO group peptidase (beta-lactamase class C family)